MITYTPSQMEIRSAQQIGRAIKMRREELSITQKELADLAGVSRLWINQVEQGKDNASFQLILRALNALDISLTTQVKDEGRSQINLLFEEL